MSNSLRSIHRFLIGQLFYPLVLSSLLALALYLGRVYLSRSWVVYLNLPWNLFLAWAPYAFSFLAAALDRLFPRRWWLLPIPGALWLIFFPNAVYIVTDFLHLSQRPYVPLWYDIALLATFAWTGCMLAIASLKTMQFLIKSYLGWIVSWLFVGAAIALGGLGIYLGRFDRWNSWDLFIHPKSILKDIATRVVNPFENLRFVGFTLIFTAFLLVIYLVFVSVYFSREQEK